MTARDLLGQQFRRSLGQTGDDAEPSRIRDRACELGKADIVHSTLDDRMLDIEQFSDGCFHIGLQMFQGLRIRPRVQTSSGGWNDIIGIDKSCRKYSLLLTTDRSQFRGLVSMDDLEQ